MITIGGKDIADIVIDSKNVTKIQDANTLEIMWEKTAPVVDYFYVENAYNGNNTIRIKTDNNTPVDSHATTLQYSKDKVNWTTVTLSGTHSFTLHSGEKVFFRNDNGYFNCYDFYTKIYCVNDYIVGGNINTLLNYQDLANVSLSNHCFQMLFYNTKLTSASNLILPTTTLASLCYYSMFQNCTSLTSAPALPATTLADSCYNYMFSGCTSLTSAPALPATRLENRCYQEMFRGCSSLNDVTCYANNISSANSLYYWLYNVSATGTFHKLGTASYPSGASGIPSGWTIVNS